jgi:hypothetical protein
LALGNPDQTYFYNFFIQKFQFLILVQVQFLKKPDLVFVWFLLTAIESNGSNSSNQVPAQHWLLQMVEACMGEGVNPCWLVLTFGSYFSREPPVSVPTLKKVCKNLQFQFN